MHRIRLHLSCSHIKSEFLMYPILRKPDYGFAICDCDSNLISADDEDSLLQLMVHFEADFVIHLIE